ncbi:MAG TPA: citrate synthase [Planctomycetota bacterium]|nr:citrate synthase [Planctomycetota bacterium]
MAEATTTTTTTADTLKVTDNRTGKSYDLAIKDGAIRAADLRQIKTGPDDFGLMAYDPAFLNTASCKSRITFIDGDKGILEYRGYPIDQLAEKSTHLEVSYLLLNGELPTKSQLDGWVHDITHHTLVHTGIAKLMSSFRYDAHPMGMLQAAVAALSTYYPDARDIADPANRALQTRRLIAKMPTLGAMAYRHRLGMPFVQPSNDLTYAGNFLQMLFRMTEAKYVPNPVLERAMNLLFILHADHEQNCSTNAMRAVGSGHTDPYSAVSAAIGALYGPLHGGANEEVCRMLAEIGDRKRIPEVIAQVKDGKRLLMGFGHRVYKNYDPRAKIIKKLAYEVFEVTGRNPLLEIALELEKIALEDEYFVKRKLYPNVDFYSGLIYQALGFPFEMFTVLFAIPRTAGWLAQWDEMLRDSEQKIARPRQIFLGHGKRDYVPVAHRA